MISFPSLLRILALTLACLTLFLAGKAHAGETPLPINSLVGDSLGLGKGRSDGTPLKNATTEIGQVPWNSTDGLVFSARGGVTVNVPKASIAIVPVAPSFTKILRVQAEVNPQGSGFTGVLLLVDADLASFWKKGALWAYLGAGGNWAVYSYGQTNVLAKGNAAASGFRTGDFNHLELLYNPKTQKVSLIINGTSVAKDVPIITAPDTIAQAGIRINEPVSANQPLVKNFAVDELDVEP